MVDKYELLGVIAEGEYGVVHKARDKISGNVVAVKILKVGFGDEKRKGISPECLREIGLLKLLNNSEYIVTLLEVAHKVDEEGKCRIYLVFEYLATNLKDFIEQRHPLNAEMIKKFMFQLCTGLAHCHGIGVLHRDLHPGNLLVDVKNQILKIADLGLGLPLALSGADLTPEVFLPNYRCPELFLGSEKYNTEVDIWCVGCVFAEMVTGKPLFDDNTSDSVLEKIFRLLGTPTEEVWPGVTSLSSWNDCRNLCQYKRQNLADVVPSLGHHGIDLLEKMLTYNPAKRISAKAALKHSYFNDPDPF